MNLGSWMLGFFLCSACCASAQGPWSDTLVDTLAGNGVLKADQTGRLNVHGNVDFYYRHVLHGRNLATTSFTDANNRFELGMMSLQLTYQRQHSGVVLDLGFGPRARAFAYTDKGAMAAVKQAYIYYEPLSGLTLSAGTWATHIGYEVLDPALNSNYSMSYLFSTGPFSNTGVKADYVVGRHHFMAGISNATDYRSVPEGVLNRKTLIARYSYESLSGLVLSLNYSGGKQVDSVDLQQIDAVVNWTVGSQWALGWNGSIVLCKNVRDATLATVDKNRAWQNWWGQAFYLQGPLAKNVQLALRGEYFEDKYGRSAIPLKGHVWSGTLTLRLTKGDFALLPELRWDRFSKPYGQGSSAGGGQSQLYGLMALTYQF